MAGGFRAGANGPRFRGGSGGESGEAARDERRGLFIRGLNARTIWREGTDVALPGGIVRRALIRDADTTVLTATDDDDTQEKKVLVFVFAGTDWGLITENMRLTVGGAVTVTLPDGGRPVVDMSRTFIVAAPLYPKWHGGVVTELAVAAYPDV